MKIPFIDLNAQRERISSQIDQAIHTVLEQGDFIQGKAVKTLEERLKAFTKSNHVITCANGTDALTLIAMAETITSNDIVFIPSFTFISSAEAFGMLGVTPYFVDVDQNTFNLDISSLKAAIDDVRKSSQKMRAIVTVDLFGQPAAYNEIREIARENNLILIADSAQALGATYHNKNITEIADYTTTSFFPAKPLGCYGDGGAVFTQNEEKATLLRSFALHGKGSEKYDNIRIGMNSRLDTVQAAILIEKLKIFPDELIKRHKIASRYSEKLENYVEVPALPEGLTSSWAQYTLKLEKRDQLKSFLNNKGIPTGVYYPLPLHQQSGYKNYPSVSNGLTNSETLSKTVLSLPMHPYLEIELQDFIISKVIEFCNH